MPESPFNTDGLPQIRAGLARRKITPELPVYLAGYFHDRLAQRVRDDLYCRALVVESGGSKIALVTLDLAVVDRAWGDDARQMIAQETDIPPENILICATHTHTGPAVRPQVNEKWIDKEWVGGLARTIADTVVEAAESSFDAMLMPGHAGDDIANCRVVRLKDGSERFRRDQEDAIGPAGPIDPELVAVSVRELDGTVRGMVACYGMHVDVIGGGGADFVSADWPGELCRTARDVYGEDTVTLFMNAPNGDVAQRPWHETRLPTSGPAKAVQIGRALAGLAVNCSEKAEPAENADCAAAWRNLEIPYYTRTDELWEHVESLRGRDDLTYFEQACVRRVDNWPHDGEIASVPVQVLRVGDTMVVGLPSEVFANWALEIKHWSPAEHTLVVSLANDWFGYIPTTDQAHRGAYGAMPCLSRRLIADAGRRLADAAQVMMWQLWDE